MEEDIYNIYIWYRIVSRIYNELVQFFFLKDNPIKTGKRLEQPLREQDKHTASQHIKRCSTSLVIREMQIKITVWYHFTTSTRWLIKNYKNIYLWLSLWSSQNFHTLMVRVYAYIGTTTWENCLAVYAKVEYTYTLCPSSFTSREVHICIRRMFITVFL